MPQTALSTRHAGFLRRPYPSRARFTVFSLVGLLATADLRAQTDVGHISGIKYVDKLHGCSEASTGGSGRQQATIWRGGAATPARAGRENKVLLQDSLEVLRRTDLRVRIESAYGRGAFFFAPDLLSCTKVYVDRVARGLRDTSRAHYSIRTVRSGAFLRQLLYLVVSRGAAFIQWNRVPGQPALVIHAGGRDVRVNGTEVAVVAYPSENAALIYVHSGTVTVVGPPDVQINAGELYEVRGESQPVKIDAPTADVAENLEYYSETVFRSALRRALIRPKVLIPAGVATGVALGIVLWPDEDNGPTSWRGTIRIPLPF